MNSQTKNLGRISKTLLFGISCLFSVLISIDAARSQSQQGWTADLSTEEGRLQLLESILSAHPQMISRSTKFNVDPLNLLSRASHLVNRLGDDKGKILEVASSRRLSYTGNLEATEFYYKDSDLNVIRTHLVNALKDITPQLSNNFHSLQNVLNKLKGADLASRSAFLVLTPLFYNSDGNLQAEFTTDSHRPEQEFSQRLRSLLEEKIKKLSGDAIDNLYRDFYQEHVLPLISGYPGWTDAINRINQRFLNGTLASKLVRHRVEQSTASSRLLSVTLEEVPKTVALFRGLIGYDCSMASVPFYALLPSVKVFWIRRSTGFHNEPDGYLLMTEVQLEGRIVPYVITVNGGTLAMADARIAILMIAGLYNSPVVLTSTGEHLVNTESMAEALWMAETRGTQLKVNLDSQWPIVERFIDSTRKHGSLNNYYKAENISQTKLIELEENEILVSKNTRLRANKVVYKIFGNAHVKSLSILDRSAIAAFSPTLAKTLEITDDQLETAKSFFRIIAEVQEEKEFGDISLGDPSLEKVLEYLSDSILPVTNEAIEGLSTNIQDISKYMSHEFKAKFLIEVNKHAPSENQLLFDDKLIQRWNRSVPPQLIKNLKDEIRSDRAESIYERLRDLSHLPKTDNVPHYFLDHLYLKDLRDPKASVTFKVLLWQNLKTSSKRERSLILEMINDSAKKDPVGFSNSLVYLTPAKWTNEIWETIHMVIQGGNKQSNWGVFEALYLHSSLKWPEKLIPAVLNATEGLNGIPQFFDALNKLEKWPNAARVYADEIIDRIMKGDSDFGVEGKYTMVDTFIKRYANLREVKKGPWPANMAERLFETLALFEDPIDTEVSENDPRNQDAKPFLRILARQPVWTDETLSDRFRSYMYIQSLDINVFVLRRASKLQHWDERIWSPLLTILTYDKMPAQLYTEIAKTIAQRPPSSWHPGFVKSFESYTKYVPRNARAQLRNQLQQPVSCQDIFR